MEQVSGENTSKSIRIMEFYNLSNEVYAQLKPMRLDLHKAGLDSVTYVFEDLLSTVVDLTTASQVCAAVFKSKNIFNQHEGITTKYSHSTDTISYGNSTLVESVLTDMMQNIVTAECQ